MRLILLIPFLLGTLFGCGVDEHTWNQRMTVTVETPEGIVSGSSVIEVRALFYENPSAWITTREVDYGYTGEAVALEVLPGQWLFALMGGPAELMYRAAPERFGDIPLHDRGAWLAEIPNQTEPVELVGDFRPRMVTFEDIDDPTSMATVDPENLAASFGAGFKLTSVRLEVTEAATTELPINTLLPWLDNLAAYRTDPDNPFTSVLPRDVGQLRRTQ